MRKPENQTFKRAWAVGSQFFDRWSQRCGWTRPSTIGEKGELAATRFLRRAGLKILTQGYRSPLGEIDIVALDGETIVFAEVKTRRHHNAGHPAEAVDERKQKQIGRLAEAFCRRHRTTQVRCRFDIVAVTWPTGARAPQIEHIVGAFSLPSVGIRSNQ